MMKNRLRIAAFGFRSLPPKEGSAGADKFAVELYPRLVKRNCEVVAYTRLYPQERNNGEQWFEGVRLISLHTTKLSGFDTWLHSFKSTLHILFFNTADIVHIHNGGNSMWAFILRLCRKTVFISQDGVDWKREKWKWYAKLYLYLSSFITAYIPNNVIFDNIFSRELFEKKFKKKYLFIPYGSEVPPIISNDELLLKLGIKPQQYFLFVGRFIPDKGIHYLVKAFEQIASNKKLVLVGGSPNPSSFEREITKTQDPRILFPGYIYGNDVLVLMKNAYVYIQPSDVEGLSPVILTVMGLKTPLICSDIKENLFVVKDTALTFRKGNVEDLRNKLLYALEHNNELTFNAERAFEHVFWNYNWDNVANEHIKVFQHDPVISN